MTSLPKKPSPPATGADLYLMRAAAAAGHRDRVAEEAPGPSPDLRAADAQLAVLLADPRLVLLVVALARRIARLEAALAANGGAA